MSKGGKILLIAVLGLVCFFVAGTFGAMAMTERGSPGAGPTLALIGWIGSSIGIWKWKGSENAEDVDSDH